MANNVCYYRELKKRVFLIHICQMTEFGKIAKNCLANWPIINRDALERRCNRVR
jgi:hypothetical protein